MAIDITLDPRNEEELLDQASRYIFNRSNGRLSNLNESNPLIFLLEAQVFAGSELLWYLNQLPKKILLTFLSQYESLVTTPAKATGLLTLNLTAALGSSYTISSLTVSDGNLLYRLITPVIFPAGTTQATGTIEALEVGSEYNLPQYSITSIATPTAFLASVFNPNSLTGGISETTPDEAIDLFTSRFRDSQITSLSDYEREVRKVIGSEVELRIFYKDGVNILIGNPETGISLSLIESVYLYLIDKAVLTSTIKVQELDYVQTKVYLKVTSDRLTDELPDQIYTAIKKLSRSQTVLTTNELIYVSAQLGLTFIDGWFDNLFGVELKDNQMFDITTFTLNINGIDYTYGMSEDTD